MELRRLVTRNDTASRNQFADLQKRDSALRAEIDAKLAKLGQKVYSEPAFTTDIPDHSGLPWFARRWNEIRDLFNKKILDRGTTAYTFYKPVLYRTTGIDTYYRGLVRLGVSTEDILREVEASGRTLIIITAIVIALVPTSGAGMSLSGPMMMPISEV